MKSRTISVLHWVVIGCVSFLFFDCASLLFLGCASVPPFAPSKPLDQAKSLQEGLLLCNEYRLPSEPKRPVTLKPFLNCLDDLADQFPAASSGYGAFHDFKNEFHMLYGTLTDQSWSERLGIEVEIAIHTSLRALWQESKPTVTPLERALVLQNFPLTAKRLDAANWNVASNVSLDPHLESLKAGLAALSESQTRQEGTSVSLGVDQGPHQAELCRRYLKLQAESNYLNGLWRDQYDFTLLVPRSPISAAVRDKYLRHLSAAVRELQDLSPEIADARAKAGFRVLACRP
jgi:hypothetical protein